MLKTSYHRYIIGCVICFIGIVFHIKTLNEFPQHKHCWAQCDRYALAQGFINNNGDFFHPQTYVLNKQFPYEFKVPSDNSVTSVDFPIHDYIVSLIMRLFHTTDPWCFKLYTLLYSLVGLFFLYRITTLFTDSVLKALFIILFATFSPTLLYYQAGFLPTIPSVANVLIGLFFFLKFQQSSNTKHFILAILFIVLATLARLPFAIVLVALICLEFLYSIKQKQIHIFKWLLFVMAIIIIGSYYAYNTYLRDVYGSLFLNHTMPADAFNDAIVWVIEICHRWAFKYFSVIHYILIVLLLVVIMALRLFKKIAFTFLENKLTLLIGILIIGCICYFFIMEFQFLDHDYYFLDTFYIPIVLLFTLLIIKLPLPNTFIIKSCFGVLILLFGIVTFTYSKNTLNTDKDFFTSLGASTADNLKGANTILDSLAIPTDAKLLVISSDGVNNSLLRLHRKGFVVIYPDSEKIKSALAWPYNYIVIENSRFANDIIKNYPTIMNDIKPYYKNTFFTLYTKSNN